MASVFERFSPFIRDYIYRSGWDELHPIQVDAARILFDTESDLLLTSATASGKTEAALFPIISMLYDDPPQSFGALYIAPLKSLINDQFFRIDELLDETGMPVWHWHGDVSVSHKTKALENPSGILQITPESLESMLMNRSNDAVRLFSDLRFVIIDEIHTLVASDRGSQILCQLARLERLIGHSPRRVGLSATLGDPNPAAEWLRAGRDAVVEIPSPGEPKLKWRLGMEHFYIQNENVDQTPEEKKEKSETYAFDAGYEYIYDCAKPKKTLIFSNSREETEYLTSTLRQIAKLRHEPDIFNIHHGNLSAAIREEAEANLKDDSIRNVTCATVTLELGIDIGRLERIIQTESPNSVSSFLQRLGRSGRRNDPPEMMMVFREEDPLPNTPLPQMIPWSLLKAIAIVQLYIEERFIEPPIRKQLPFSLLFQQTLSILASSGELTPKALAERVLVLPPFAGVTKEQYRTLLVSMVQNDFLELTEEKGLIVGIKGEKLISSFKFYAVFKDSEDFTVRNEADEIGTITTPPPVGDRFALAGRVWEVEELDIKRRLIFVKKVDGKMEISWPGDYGEVHTKILEKMREVLAGDTVYPYLKPNAQRRLEAARILAKNTGMLEKPVVHLGGYTWCFFPWLGTRSFRAFRRFLGKNASSFGIHSLEFEGCYYLTFKMENGNGASLLSHLARAAGAGIDPLSLIGLNEAPVFEKYDPNIPSSLLRDAYAADKLRTDEVVSRLNELTKRN